jgi:hypothetical protein
LARQARPLLEEDDSLMVFLTQTGEDVFRKHVRRLPAWYATDNVPMLCLERALPEAAETPQFPLPLPANRAVVVQLRAQPSGARCHGTGASSMVSLNAVF